jgi:hypothetical protein
VIHLDRDATAAETELREQIGDGPTLREEAFFSVDDHGHGPFR